MNNFIMKVIASPAVMAGYLKGEHSEKKSHYFQKKSKIFTQEEKPHKLATQKLNHIRGLLCWCGGHISNFLVFL